MFWRVIHWRICCKLAAGTFCLSRSIIISKQFLGGGSLAEDSNRDELEQLRRRNAELEQRLLDVDPEIVDIFKNIQDLFYRADNEGRLQIISPSIFNILGYRPNELIGTKLAELYVQPEDRDRLLHSIVEGEGSVTGFEAAIRRKDGEIVWVSINSQYFYDAEGNVVGVEGTVRDISEQIKSQERYRKVLETALDGFWMIDVSSLSIIEVNNRYCQMSGYCREELIGMTIPMLEGVQSEEDIRRNVESLIREGGGRFESKHRKKNGELMDLEISVQCLNEFGQLTAFMRDITEQKMVAAAREESELKYRSLFDLSPDAMILLEMGHGFIDCNDTALKMFGYRHKAEFLGKRPDQLSPLNQPDGRDSQEAALEQIMNAKAKGAASFEWVHQRADGETFPTEVNLKALQLGEKLMIYGAVRDISLRQKAKVELDESELKYRTLFEMSPDALIMGDMDRGFVDCNAMTLKIFGCKDKTEFLGLHPEDLSPPLQSDGRSSSEASREQIKLALEKGANNFEWQHKRLNGELFPAEVLLTPIRLGGRQLFQAVVRDISRRKQADEMIRKANDELEQRVEERTRELAKLFNEYRTTTRTVPDILYRLDREGKLTWWNEAVEKLSGLSAEQLKNRPMQNFVVDHDVERAIESFTDTITTGSGEVEVRLHTISGPRIFQLRGRKFVDETGEENGVVGIGRDITVQKEAEEKLRRSQHGLAAAQRMAHMGSWTLDVISNRLEWSDELYRIFEIDPGTPLSYEIFLACVYPEDREKVNAAYNESIETNKSYQVEHRAVMPDGRIKYLLEQCETIYDGEGRALYSMGTTFDITERKHAEEKQRELEVRLFQAQRMESLGTLAGGIAHDFNNVLGAIGINNFLLNRELESEKGRDLLHRNEQLISHSKQMIQQLLLFSDKRRNEMKRFCLSGLLKDSLHTIRLSLGERIFLQLDLPDGKMPVEGDAGQIQQILLNLINNARDAVELVEAPSIQLEASVIENSSRLKRKFPDLDAKRYIAISVSDNGAGIQEKDMPHVLEPFFTTKGVGRGTGLGLSMAYGTVQAHKGEMEIISEVEEGTKVIVYLPLYEDELPDAAEEKPVNQVVRGSRELILLADDDRGLRVASREALELLGYRVLEASDGNEAVDVFNEHRHEIAMALLDVVMPSMNGVEAANLIRQSEPNLPIIFMTGYDMKQTLASEKRPDDCRVLGKPVDMAQLSREIRTLLYESAD